MCQVFDSIWHCCYSIHIGIQFGKLVGGEERGLASNMQGSNHRLVRLVFKARGLESIT